MASSRKIRSFAEYDRIRKEREEQFPQQVESELEQLILKDLRPNFVDVKIGGNRLTLVKFKSIRDIFDVVFHGSNALHHQADQRRNEFRPKTEQTLVLTNFQENVQDLIRCGVYLAKSTQALPSDDQQSFYSRFVDQVQYLVSHRKYQELYEDAPNLSSCLRRFHYPQQQTDLDSFETVLTSLRKKNYLSPENVKTIYELLTKKPLLTVPPTPRASARLQTPAPVSVPLEENGTVQEKMEYLTAVFHLERDVAARYAGTILISNIDQFHNGLVAAVGSVDAQRIVQYNPDILLYTNNNLAGRYLRAITVVQERIRRNGDRIRLKEKYGPTQHPEKYASLDALLKLKEELMPTFSSEQAAAPLTPSIDISTIEIYKYQVLHRHESVMRRLDALIETGSVQVTQHEHWSGDDTTAGARSRNILKKMKCQISAVFQELGRERPELIINHGQYTLSMPDQQSRQLLRQIRDEAYKIQR